MTRRWLSPAFGLVLVVITGGCATSNDAAYLSRSERVALAQRTVWDRYGEVSPMPGMGTSAPSESQAMADMIAHHLDAIDGSQRIAATTSSVQVREFALRLVRVQSEQVRQMREWLATWFKQTPDAQWAPMFADPATTASDAAYLSVMIAHHQHAIEMYSGWVAMGVVQHDELGLLAARIAQGQEGEIAFMRQLAGEAFATG